MRNLGIILTAFVYMFSGEIHAQDIHSIFNNKLTQDRTLSSQTLASDGLLSVYGSAETRVYSYKGSFQEAVSTMKAPGNSNVGTVTDQPLGNNISMYLLMTENLDPKPMNEAWYQKARKKVSEYENISGKSLSVTINPDQMQDPESLRAGDRIEMRFISITSPYMDFDNLKIVEGTWVSETRVSTLITQDMLDDDSQGFEDGWDEEEMDMDVDLPSGVYFVSFDDVADSEWLQGDVNYLVEMSTDQAVNFFRNGQKRFVHSFEQAESYSQDDDVIMVSYFYLLKHKGELKPGDDVVSMTIQPAPKSILTDALGRNQGTWTLISISRWTEEDY
ncbi:MAG: hypothetical protein R3356_06125 [Eudoraea sp.]|nr:hypothetical protein [Eudoraea sp.]